VILGRPWIDTVDAFIGHIYGNMFTSWGDSVKQVTLYPPSKSMIDIQNVLWFDDVDSDKEIS
jgi:hypothetical protein